VQAGSSPASAQARYLYGADGMRVKKWVRRNGVASLDESTVYVDGLFEHHRWRKTGRPGETNHLHVMDDRSRVALKRVGQVHPDDRGPDVQYHLGEIHWAAATSWWAHTPATAVRLSTARSTPPTAKPASAASAEALPLHAAGARMRTGLFTTGAVLRTVAVRWVSM